MKDPTPPDTHRYALYVHVFLFNVYSETNSVGLESLLNIQDLIIWNLYFFCYNLISVFISHFRVLLVMEKDFVSYL